MIPRLALAAAFLSLATSAFAQTPTPSPVATPFPAQDLPPVRGVPPGFDEQIAPPPAATPTPPTDAAPPSPVPVPVPSTPAPAPAPEGPFPLQLTLHGGAHTKSDTFDHRRPSPGFGALWVGGAFHPLSSAARGLFVGPGLEGTVDGTHGLYQWSIGTGMRLGYTWRDAGDALPRTYVFTRVTPFLGMRTIADEAYLQDLGEDGGALSRAGAGVRVGIGVVSPAWNRFAIQSLLDDPGTHHASSPGEAIACCVMGAILALTNSLEVTGEVYDEEGEQGTIVRFGFRMGIGL